MMQQLAIMSKNSDEVSQRMKKEMVVRESFSPFFCSLWIPQANVTKMFCVYSSANLARDLYLGSAAQYYFQVKHAVLFWVSETFLVFVSYLCILTMAQHISHEGDVRYIVT